MPQVITRDFGELECDPSAILEFPHGLPGFETERRFVLIERGPLAPAVFLQSLETPEVCFLTIPVSIVDPDYQIGITAEDVDVLGIELASGIEWEREILSLAILAGSAEGVTANLLAPIFVNPKTRVGVQAVRADQ